MTFTAKETTAKETLPLATLKRMQRFPNLGSAEAFFGVGREKGGVDKNSEKKDIASNEGVSSDGLGGTSDGLGGAEDIAKCWVAPCVIVILPPIPVL